MTSKQQQVESLSSEIQILQKKLDSKTKAFAILINELETLKHERDQFKSLVDSLQEKCVQLKRQASNKVEPLGPFHSSQPTYEYANDFEARSQKAKESTVHLLKSALKTIQDEKETLQTRIDELTSELNDVKGDLTIFRQKRHRNRLGSNSSEKSDPTTHASHSEEQSILLQRLEQANERINQLENDLKLIVCQKEELEIERDSYKVKYSKLNLELNKMLHGQDKPVIDIELLLSENRYFKEKIQELTQEKNAANVNAAKYKDLLQTHRSAYNNLGKVQSSGSILTHKQVRSLLNQSYLVPTTPETEHDLKSIAEALCENIKDKNVTIIHQRKTNKILANRVAELEKLLADSHLASRSDQTSSLIHLLDGSPPPPAPDTATSQFVNSIDDLQQTSPTQIFSFPSTWPASPPPSQRTSDDDFANKVKEFKATPSFVKSTLECRHSRRVSNRSESIDLEMEDPLQSPTLTPAIAYLEERDLLPSTHSNTTITENLSTDDDIDQLQNLLSAALDKNANQSTSPTTTNLTC